jgi:hypothetical protein
MIKVQFKNGRTVNYDISESRQFKLFRDLTSDPSQFGEITALAINTGKVLHTMPKPNLFGEKLVKMGAEVIRNGKKGKISGETLWYQVGKLVISYTVYSGSLGVTKVLVKEVAQ